MHDIFLEGAVVIEEFVSDPELHLIVLLCERALRHQPSMDEDAQIILDRRSATRPATARSSTKASMCVVVGRDRRVAAIGEKLRHLPVAAAGARHHLFVIAAQTDRAQALKIAHQPHDLARRRPAVDIIAQKDEPRRLLPSLALGIGGDLAQQAREMVLHAVNVADRNRDHDASPDLSRKSRPRRVPGSGPRFCSRGTKSELVAARERTMGPLRRDAPEIVLSACIWQCPSRLARAWEDLR